MVTEENNGDHRGAGTRRAVPIMALSTIGVAGCIAASQLWPTVTGTVSAAMTGVAFLLEVFRATRNL